MTRVNIVSQCVGVQDGPSLDDCPSHMTTLLKKALRVCISAGQEDQVRHLLPAYDAIFQHGETQVGRADPVEHCVPVEPAAALIRLPSQPSKGS